MMWGDDRTLVKNKDRIKPKSMQLLWSS